MHHLYGILFLTRVKPRGSGALGSPQTAHPLPGLRGMQSPSAALPGCSAKPTRSLLCWGEGGSVYGLLQPMANKAPGAACRDGDSP